MENIVGFYQRVCLGRTPRARVREMLTAASNGSMGEIQLIALLSNALSPGDTLEALGWCCTTLSVDVPAPNPNSRSLNSLRSTQDLTFLSLLIISHMPVRALKDPQSPVSTLFQASWPNILKWMKYFYDVITTNATGTTSNSPPDRQSSNDNTLRMPVLAFLNSLIMRVSRHCNALHKKSILHDGLLDFIVKIWLETEDVDPRSTLSSNDPMHNTCWLVHLRDGIVAVEMADEPGNDVRRAEARSMVLRKAGGDARLVANRLLPLLKHRAKLDKENSRVFGYLVVVIVFLAIEDTAVPSSKHTEFMEAFLKDDLVPLMVRLLSFMLEDLSRPQERRTFSEDTCALVIQTSTVILHNCIHGSDGMHWATVLFKLGVLRTSALLLDSPQYLGHFWFESMRIMLGKDLPPLLCHRGVVVAAINSVKEIEASGLSRNFRSSSLKESWATLESVLMDRTVLNAIYERDFVEDYITKSKAAKKSDSSQCFQCKKDNSQTTLFKCGGCKLITYCSKDCQKSSWKEGHRLLCKDFHYVSQKKGLEVGFMRTLGAFELHRHALGALKQRFEQVDSDGERTPLNLKGMSVHVDLCDFPPAIIENVSYTSEQPLSLHTRVILDSVRRADDGRFHHRVSVSSGLWGAMHVDSVLPRTFLEDVEGDVRDPGDFMDVPYLTRLPAKDRKGTCLPFILDEVDEVTMEARKNFRPPTSNNKYSPSSPKTIYDYVEQMVACRERQPWSDCLLASNLPRLAPAKDEVTQESESFETEGDVKEEDI